MNLAKKVTTATTAISLFLFTASQVFAAANGTNVIPGDETGIINAPNLTLQLIVKYVVIILVAVGTIGALIFLIWGAVKWIISGGDKDKVDAARKQIVAAIIGLVILFLAVVILSAVVRLLGVGDSIFNVYIPSAKCFLNNEGCKASSV